MFKRLLSGQDHLAADGWGGAEGDAGVGGGGGGLSASSLAVGNLLCHCTFCHYRTATVTAALVQAPQAVPRLVRDLAGTRSCRAAGARKAGHSSDWRSVTGGREGWGWGGREGTG